MKKSEILRRKTFINITLFVLFFLLFGVQDVQGRAKTDPSAQRSNYSVDSETIQNLYRIEADFPPDFPSDKILAHVSNLENVPLEELKIVNVTKKFYESLGKEFWLVKVENLNTFVTYGTSLDISDGSFIDDYHTLESAEQDAYFAKYGVLKKTLYERLQSIKDEDLVPVGIWIIATPKYTEEEVFAALASQYPEAQESLEESGNPFDIDNRDLLHQIENEYTSRMIEGIQPQLQPIIDLLSERGFSASFTEGMPAITATLPKSMILELASRADVGSIGLVDQELVETMDTALYSDRAPVVWSRGFRGNGIHIGILEAGKLNFQYVRQGAIRTPACNSQSVSPHKVEVGNIAASFDNTPAPGIAPDAYVDDACTDGTVADTVSGLAWATNVSDPINHSMAARYTYQQEYLDMAFDYWAKVGLDTVVVSSGNARTLTGLNLCAPEMYVTSPAVGWNVIAVGASNNNNTVNWYDDTMWSDSCYKNPVSGDREKPELVAPGVDIYHRSDNQLVVSSGTSLSAPQVTGVAALLIDRNVSLDPGPNAVKAILMASALHNVEGSSISNPYTEPSGDGKDGAGAIDAAIADTIATTKGPENSTPCNGPCWWNYTISPGSLPVGNYLNRYIQVKSQDKVRVAISWFSSGGCTSQQTCSDYLSTNLDLQIFDPSGVEVSQGAGLSFDNNYEIVEFTANTTGQYRIGVYRASINGESSNTVGIAWTKVPVGSGAFDDAANSISYSGSWTHSSGTWPRSYLNTVSWSNTTGDTYTLNFRGSKISRVYNMGPNRGYKYIYIDEELKDNQSDYSPDNRWQVAKTWTLPDTNHTIRVEVTAGGYIDLDAFVVNVSALGPGTIDNSIPQVKYIGNNSWTHSSSWPNAYNSTLSWSNTPEDAVALTFEGTQVIYYCTKSSNRGTAKINLDGENKGSVYLWSSSPVWQATCWNSGTLPYGVHTLHISIQGDGYVDVDKFWVN